MNGENLIQIFSESACLTRRQLKDYAAGCMANEEARALETHLNSCPFCSDASDGMLAGSKEAGISLLTELNNDFLQERYSITHPHIHLNAITHTGSPVRTHKKKNVHPLWRNISIAALLLLCLAIVWFLQYDKSVSQGRQIIPQASVEKNKRQENTVVAATKGKNILKEERGAEMAAPVSKEKKPVNDKKTEATPVKEQVKTTTAKGGKMVSARSKTGTDKKSADVSSDTANEVVKKDDKPVFEMDKLQMGDVYFGEKKFDIALVAYQQATKNENPEMRDNAAFKAAKCYVELGKETKAKGILQKLAANDGSHKKAAQNLLAQIK